MFLTQSVDLYKQFAKLLLKPQFPAGMLMNSLLADTDGPIELIE